MILILLGTQDAPFTRILNEVEKNILNGKIKDEVIAQKGSTKFSSDLIKTFDFIPKEEMQKLIKRADLIITHGGVGTITECLCLGKKVIVIPRLKKYKEHTNDHQLQITKAFAQKGYIIPLYDEKKLLDALKLSKKFKPKMYVSNNDNFKAMIKRYIDLF